VSPTSSFSALARPERKRSYTRPYENVGRRGSRVVTGRSRAFPAIRAQHRRIGPICDLVQAAGHIATTSHDKKAPRFDGAERMLDGLAPLLHCAWIAVQSRLRSLEHILALPPPDAALLLAIVDEVILVEPPACPRIRRRRFRNIDVDAGLLAIGDLIAVEVSLVGENLDFSASSASRACSAIGER